MKSISNVEIVNLVVMALLNGCTDNSDPIVAKSWVALDDAFKRGHKQGYEEGYQAGLVAAGQAETAAVLVIEGMCHRVDRMMGGES